MARSSIPEYPVFLKEEQQNGDPKNHPCLDDLVRNSAAFRQQPETSKVDRVANPIGANVAQKRRAAGTFKTERDPAIEREADQHSCTITDCHGAAASHDRMCEQKIKRVQQSVDREADDSETNELAADHNPGGLLRKEGVKPNDKARDLAPPPILIEMSPATPASP